ncbi:phage tail protein [Salininema proteolyticum]|uniref:Phage-related protein n=1 Tax=Salininema proteolyticum TaxID=1607685 RepID=A0ABV8TYX8_9ACTN
MPKVNTVGKVAIKVLPSTTGFGRQVKKELNGALKRIEKQLRKVAIKIDLAEASAAQVRERIRAWAENLDPWAVDVTLDQSSMSQASAKLKAWQAQFNEARMELKLDGTDAAEAQLKTFLSEQRQVLIGLELPDEEQAKAEQALADWENDNEPRDIRIVPDLSRTAVTLTNRRIGWLTRARQVVISPVIDNAAFTNVATTLAALSGARLAWTGLDKITNQLKDLDKALPIWSAWSLGLANVTGWLAAATSNLLSLGAGLAATLPAALALPGILTGIGIGLGALVAVVKDFNQVLPEVKDQLAVLQDQMSAAFWARAAEPIRGMIDTLFPAFAAGLRDTSSVLGTFAANLSTSLAASLESSIPGMFADLTTSIEIAATATDAYAETIRILGEVGAGMLPRLSAWFTDNAEAFAAFLQRAEADGSLQRWVDTAVENLGHLGDIIAATFSTFSGLAGAAADAGAASLESFAARMQSISDVVNSPEFQEPLTAFLASAHRGMQALADTAGPAVRDLFITLGETMQTILPVAGHALGTLAGGLAEVAASPAVQGGLTDLFNGIALAIYDLEPLWGPLGAGLGALLSLGGQFAESAGPLLAGVFGTLAETAAIVAPALEPVVAVLAGGLLSAVQAAAPLVLAAAEAFAGFAAAIPFDQISGFATAFGGPILEAVFGLGAAFAPLIEFGGRLVAEVLAPLAAEWLPKIAAIVTGFINDGLTPLISAFGRLVDLLEPILLPALKFVGDVLLDSIVFAFEGAMQVVTGFLEIISGLIDFVVGVFTGDWELAWSGVKSIFEGIWDLIVGGLKLAWVLLTDVILGGAGKLLGKLGEWAAKLWPRFQKWFGDLWRKAVALQGEWTLKLLNKIKEWGTSFIEWVKSLWPRFKKWFGDLWDKAVLLQARMNEKMLAKIREWGESLINWVKGLGRKFVDKFKDMWRKVVDGVKSWARNMVRKLGEVKDGMIDRANQIKSLLPKKFQQAIDKAITSVKKLPSKAKKALKGIKDTLIEAGKNLIRGFITGIQDMWGDVQDSLGDLTDALTDWKGPPEKDRKLLIGAGQLVIEGFIEGLESKYAAVRASLAGLSREVADTEIAPVEAPDVVGEATAVLHRSASARGETEGAGGRVLNYYAAPNQSLSEEEALFVVAARSRRLGW